MTIQLRTVSLLLVLSLSAIVPSILLLRGVAAGGGTSFTTFEVAGNPFLASRSVGTVCPSTSGTCVNTMGEPQIRADPSGNFYASSESGLCVIDRQCGGTFAWKSTDGGQSYKTLPLPNSLVLNGTVGQSVGGGDTDIAVAPVKNANGQYNVYVASLHFSLFSVALVGEFIEVAVSTSGDGGATWSINPAAATIPYNDRPWIAADGANKVCISYHDVAATFDIFVDCSYDGGLTFTQVTSAFDDNHLWLNDFNNQIGNIAIDPNNHVIYESFAGLASQSEGVACLVSCNITNHAVWMAVSIDGGKSFVDHAVYINPDTTVSYNHQFTNVAVDKAGNVYTAFSDNHNIYYSFSTDFGNTWSSLVQVNQAPSNTAIFPWISAGTSGRIDVAWYGSLYFDGVNVPDNYPMSASWYVYFAQNLQATKAGSTFTQTPATQIIHYGGVCEQGTNCQGNRDLLDDFGVAANPVTGLASIIYTSDQFVNSSNEPAFPHTGTFVGCTPTTSNTSDCEHTDIATQLSGTSIFKKHTGFEIERADLQQRQAGSEFDFALTNTASAVITSITIQVNGLSLNLTWNSAMPLQSGQVISGTTTTIPLGLLLAVGEIYSLTVTATYDDGTSVSQTTSVLYTLNPLQLP
jgi:hypothetical protein